MTANERVKLLGTTGTLTTQGEGLHIRVEEAWVAIERLTEVSL